MIPRSYPHIEGIRLAFRVPIDPALPAWLLRSRTSPIRSTTTVHSRAEAPASGIGLKTLLSSRFQNVFYDSYVSSTVPLTTKLRAKAALGVFSPHGSGASQLY
jgi:hypothetical protein